MNVEGTDTTGTAGPDRRGTTAGVDLEEVEVAALPPIE